MKSYYYLHFVHLHANMQLIVLLCWKWFALLCVLDGGVETDASAVKAFIRKADRQNVTQTQEREIGRGQVIYE